MLENCASLTGVEQDFSPAEKLLKNRLQPLRYWI